MPSHSANRDIVAEYVGKVQRGEMTRSEALRACALRGYGGMTWVAVNFAIPFAPEPDDEDDNAEPLQEATR